jgi:NAD dependent epimerase/dehydratase family
MFAYLPAKFRIRFLEPIDTANVSVDPAPDTAQAQTVAQEVRARIQENLDEMLAVRRSVWFGCAPGAVAEEAKGTPRAPYRTKRVLVTGLSTYWGSRLAQALESHPEIEAIVGVDSSEPMHELKRTEFVKVSNQHSLIGRIVRAAELDTVVDTRLIVNAITASAQLAHENNVIGTMNILTACAGADSPVRRLVFKSSCHYYGCEQDDPAFFTEAMTRPHPPRTAIERDIVEAEAALSPRRCAGSGSGSRTRWSTSSASGAGSTTASSRRPASATSTRRARRCSSSAST